MTATLTVIDISIDRQRQETDSETTIFSALRFENGVAVDRFCECVNSAVLSDDPSDFSGNTDDQIRNTGTIMEDAYWQLIEFCYESIIVSSHGNSDVRALKRICQEYSLPAPHQHIIDLDAIFRLRFHEGYSSRIAENQLDITTAETGDWRDLDIAGKAYLELLKDGM